jgi:hypothetical protein
LITSPIAHRHGAITQLLGRPVQRANLVAIRVTQVRQIDLARRAFAKTRWVFARSAAVGHTRRMPGVALLGRLHGKPDGAAIAMCSRRAIDRRGNGKRAGGAAVEIPVLVSHARGQCPVCPAAHRKTSLTPQDHLHQT